METTSRAEAERLLGIAEKLLEAKDLNAARDFALLAQETETLLDGSDQILAIADVLIAGDKQINDNHHHWYEILQIDIHQNDDVELIKRQYRRLALLLHPDKNRFPSGEPAFKLVGDAWAVLSDPARKIEYDKELFEFLKVDLVELKNRREKEGRNVPEKRPENIWTPCPYCYNLYEYPRVYEGFCLRCENCDRAFEAVVIPPASMPPTVPGKDAYYCCQSFFPARSETGKIAASWPPVDPLPNVGAGRLPESGEGFVCATPPPSRQNPRHRKNQLLR